MFLMSLTKWDYLAITVFLALCFLIAYIQRRKNPDSDTFLGGGTKFDSLLSVIGEFGIIEVILAGIAGAYLGFNAIYYIGIIILLQQSVQILIRQRYRKVEVTNFNDYINIKFNKAIAAVIAVIHLLLLIFCVSITIAIGFKSLQALMGFGFINNVMGLLGFTVMCVLIGGRIGASYTKLLCFAFIFLVFGAAIFLGLTHLGGIGGLQHNLVNLAVAQKFPPDYYLLPVVNKDTFLLIALVFIGYAGFKLINFRIESQQANPAAKFIGRICLLIILVLPAVIALGTTPDPGVNGKRIVTVMAQSPVDGQTAYIVKAVDDKEIKQETSPGIIPAVLNDKTSMVESGKYNYNLANIVVFRHYLPKPLIVIALIMIFAAFMLTISDLMFKLGRITVNNFLIPLNLIARYGKIGELWSLQVAIVSYTGITLAISYALFVHYDLLFFMKIISLTLVAPLFIILCLSLFIPDKN